jgi:hypothetical protein
MQACHRLLLRAWSSSMADRLLEAVTEEVAEEVAGIGVEELADVMR